MAQKNQKPEAAPTGLPAVPWKPWLGVVFTLLLFFLSQLFAAILISIYPMLRHWSVSQGNDWLNSSVAAQFIYTLLVEAISIAGVYFFAKRYTTGLVSIGLRRPRRHDLLSGLAMAPLYYFAYFAVVATASAFIKGLNVDQTQEIGFTSVHGGAEMVMTFVSLVVLPPLAEEFMMRGVLYGSLRKAMPVVWAAVLTSLLFAAAHLPEGGAAGPLYIAAIDTFILSLFLIRLREKTGGLWAGVVLHAIKNGVAFIALFVLNIR